MAGEKNKVKFNLKNVHYAPITAMEAGKPTYGTPVAIPGAVSISLEAQSELSTFYADGIAYYVSSSSTGYEGDLEMAIIPEDFKVAIFGDTKDDKGVITENVNSKPKEFALLFEFDGDVHEQKHCLYNCTATRPSVESKTNEETKDPTTETMTIKASPLADGVVKRSSGDTADETTVKNWYTKVYEPAANLPSRARA